MKFLFNHYTMNISKTKCQKKFAQTKVITVLDNIDVTDILTKRKAAEIGGAHYIDIVAHPNIVSFIQSIISLPICVSSINLQDLYNCVMAGADIVEIGNFDCLYNKNIFLSNQQIINLEQETNKKLSNSGVMICVTIQYHLSLIKQTYLALHLECLGIDIIQTEGQLSKIRRANIHKSQVFNSTYTTSSPISSAYALSRVVKLPIIAYSGIDLKSTPIAFEYGASSISTGSTLNKLDNMYQMSSYINDIVFAVNQVLPSFSNSYLIIDKTISMNK